MEELERQVTTLMAELLVRKYGIRASKVRGRADLDLDLRMDGDDISDFLGDLETEFGINLKESFFARYWPNGLRGEAVPLVLDGIRDMVVEELNRASTERSAPPP